MLRYISFKVRQLVSTKSIKIFNYNMKYTLKLVVKTKIARNVNVIF